KGPRVFKYEWEGDTYNLTNKRLNDYVKIYLGDEFSAKDFRTWGGTLLAAIYLAERAGKEGFPESEHEQKRSVTAVMRRVAERLGNTPGSHSGVVRLACSCRAVPGRANDRRLSASAFTYRQSTRRGPIAGRTGNAQPVAFVANSTCTRGCLVRGEFL